MFGLIALDDTGRGIGMANCVVHASTWSRRPKCYLEDLFVAPSARGHDIGRALLEAVKQAGTERGAPRVYWHTQQYNGRARSLYDQVGTAHDLRRLRDVARGASRLSQPFRRLAAMPGPTLRIPAPARAGR